ncbi:MAG: dephospho-CoA kinase [Geobacteraceae bacterium]|nr:dephospho-CoA kinase [Geobacteraceae bacterium]
MRIIGLTGGIASGKSAVAELMTAAGIPVIDADQLSREAVLPGSTPLAFIAETFGNSVIDTDGRLNREALARIVFSDEPSRKRLEAILHPAIKSLAEQKLADLQRSGAPAAIYMAALLIEAGATDRVDEIWVVYTDPETQLGRIQKRDGVSRENALKRVAAQMPMDEKAACGRIVIDNCGTLDELKEKVAAVLIKEKIVPGN